ncbi:TonB-dependent siderophore myxochelin receptor MxcH [Labilithrix luteola]|uniref:TonB-dependent siderophore myxochelin receptor MxcH n=1 Tax=Labilithrix luteola TaxID=1391654 RepID=UPI0014749BE6|nr:TonB-dependent siderophore myxochelin receptor MxcH [Labilithrix luteola]
MFAGVVFALLAHHARSAHAQPWPGRASEAPAVTPPELLEASEAEYPAEARAEGIEATVVLRIDVDVEGRVTRAEVHVPVGFGFDEAAKAAALRLRFAPARRDGQPIAVRILHRYDFRLPEPAPVETPPAPAPSASEAAPAAPAPPAPPAKDAPMEVTVRGMTEGERLQSSAQAVHVVDTKLAKREAADMGEVLARSEGVSVQRGGGLGSSMRLSLNGLTDEQVRFFLDGVPLELSGYPWGISNVPVNLVKRVEVYRGVVPIRFGADALGGAVNLASDTEVKGTHGAASYQIGSFGTHRTTLGVQTLDDETGLFARVSGFFDHADNDYPIEVDAPDKQGRLSTVTVNRFHDAYSAWGANAEAGFVRRPWAKRLLVRAFVADYSKELQHNPVMTVPYGEVSYDRMTAGGSLRYENVFARSFPVDVVAGYSFAQTNFRDLSKCIYNWYGNCIGQRQRAGELENKPHDQVVWDKSVYARANAGWRIHPEHTVRLAVAPTYTYRTGEERTPLDPTARDPLTASRRLLTVVSGLEETSEFFERRLENIVFVKDYYQVARAEQPLTGSNVFNERPRDTHQVGFGDAVRYRFVQWLYGKASYEYATRLPTTTETFGDGVLVAENLGLEPETSHNVNVGATVDVRDTGIGDFRADTNGFLRAADKLIVLLGNDRNFQYQNVYSARALGVETQGGWTSPGEYLALDGNVTYVDFRNTENEGTFGAFEGDRIPNRPYFFANGSARVLLRGLASARDELSFVWNTRWVHEFYRGWESVGAKAYKQVIPAQLTHSAALTYLTRPGDLVLTFTAEAQNITDRQVFDFFGVQRPGRAFYVKTTLEF